MIARKKGMSKDAASSSIRDHAGHEESRTQWVGADSILFATAHRPWPAPMAPWIMTQRWNDLLFLHYPVAPEAIRPLVPGVLTLDTYKQRAWVTVTPFWINHLRPPGVPSLPWLSHFSEINVRTYVTYDSKPGVYFFSLDASNLSAVWGARVFYRLPYWRASMKVKGRGGPKLEYVSKRQHGPKPAELHCSYGPASEMFHARPGSIEHFLTERYCLYAFSRKRLYRGEIHHLPWNLQLATFDVEQNTMAQPAGIQLPPQPELVHFARELKVLFWAPERLR
ncbi:MAG: DUF2071 domain-containing protein [Candidatus Korobacteraceae bacterium]